MLLLVGNPTAQSGKNAARIERVRHLLEAAGVVHDFQPTEPGGATVGRVEESLRTERYDTAVYMGGDGTFAEVAKGILASGRAEAVRLGMLPTGTANDQGKSFGLSSAETALEANVGVILEGRERRLDAGKITIARADGTKHEDWFFDSAGWGLSPRVLALRNEDRELIAKIPIVRELWRDHLVYAGALLRTFLSSYVDDDTFDVEVETELDRRKLTGLTDLVVKGTRVYGGAWVFDPTSEPDDGRFEVHPFHGKSDWVSKAIVHLDETGAVNESLAAVGVKHSDGFSARHIALTFTQRPGAVPLLSQIDGEEFPAAMRVDIAVVARALRLIVPAAYSK